jgi:hypothetical protein
MAEQPSSFESDRAPGSEITGFGGANGAQPVDERSAFLDAMVHAMQATLTAARTRVAEDVERRRVAHIAAINARREVEVGRIHALADEDAKAIATWAAAERLRIQFERERRTQELQADLESSLAEHGSKIDSEIESAEAAIAAHRAEIDAFFAALQRETDPVAIAQWAIRRPLFPDLDAKNEGPDAGSPSVSLTELPASVAVVGAQEQLAVEATVPPEVAVHSNAPAVAVHADAPAVAVMDELAAKRARWWAMWTALPDPPPVLLPVDQADLNGDLLEPVGVGAEQDESDSGSVSS